MLLPPEYGPENLGENNILTMASAAVEPTFIDWWSAAAYHGFTTQRPMNVLVAVLRQYPSKVIEGAEVRFAKITPQKFVGYETYNVYGRDVMISLPEKTLIDCLDRPDMSGVLQNLRASRTAPSEKSMRKISWSRRRRCNRDLCCSVSAS